MVRVLWSVCWGLSRLGCVALWLPPGSIAGHRASAPPVSIIDPKDGCLIARVYGCACLTSWAAASAWATAVAPSNGGCATATQLLLDQQQPPGIHRARQQACGLVVACMASCVCWKQQHCRTLSDELETQPGQDKVCRRIFKGWPHPGLTQDRTARALTLL